MLIVINYEDLSLREIMETKSDEYIVSLVENLKKELEMACQIYIYIYIYIYFMRKMKYTINIQCTTTTYYSI